MLLGLYPFIQGAGTKKPCPANFDCRHFANTGETHQSFRMHSTQENSSLASLQQGFKVWVFHKITHGWEPWGLTSALDAVTSAASALSEAVTSALDASGECSRCTLMSYGNGLYKSKGLS